MAIPVNSDRDHQSAAKLLNLPEPATAGEPATKGYADATWSKTFVIHNADGVVVGDHSGLFYIPGAGSIAKWFLVAYDGNNAPFSSTLTASVRMEAWANPWTTTVGADDLSGTMPALAGAVSANSASPGLGALTAGEILEVVISAVSGTAPKTVSLTLVGQK